MADSISNIENVRREKYDKSMSNRVAKMSLKENHKPPSKNLRHTLRVNFENEYVSRRVETLASRLKMLGF